jgi:predicted dehydrogenase
MIRGRRPGDALTPGDDLTVGIVGLGYWGPNLARVLSDMDGIAMRWLCDADPTRLAKMARRYPGAMATIDFDDLLDDRALDAILIATPVFTHFDLGRRSLEAGKHTFVEKPLASSAAEVDALIELGEENDLVLRCGHTFLYSPPVRHVKRILDSGELGDLHFISSSRVNLGLHQSDVSVVWDLAPHDFSILRYWLGESPISISSVGRDIAIPGIHEVAFITMRYDSGLIASVEMSWLAPSKLRRTVLVGSEKMVVYEDGAPESVKVYDQGVVLNEPATFGEYQLSYRTGDVVAPRIDSSEPLALEIEDFARSIHAGARADGHGELCRDVVALIEAAEESMALDGAQVTPATISAGV